MSVFHETQNPDGKRYFGDFRFEFESEEEAQKGMKARPLGVWRWDGTRWVGNDEVFMIELANM